MLADVNTHLDWLKGIFRRKATAITVAGGRVPTILSVDKGLMQGVREAYSSDTIIIGSAIGCDVVLMDDGVLPNHATLQLRRSAFGILVEVRAAGAVTMGSGALVAGEASGFQRLPQSFSIGEASLTLSGTGETAARFMRPHGTVGLVGIVSFVLALALAVPLVHMLHSPAPRAARVALDPPPPAEQAALTEEFRKSVEAELVRLQLQDSVALGPTAANLLPISGRIPAAKWDAWRSFTQWYDQQSGAPVLVQSVGRATELATLKPVGMIRLSEPAEIRFIDGETRKVGEILDENWLIESITSDGLVLSRGEDITEIAF